MDLVAVIPSANIRTAHAHDEKRYRDDDPEEDSGYYIDNYGESGHDRYYQQIEQHQTTMARCARAYAANEVNRPGVNVLNCDYHDGGRKYDTRYVACDREQDAATATLIRTESDVFAPKARLARLGPMLMPLVIPPTQAESTFPMPSRIRSRLPSAFFAPAGVTSLAQRSASITATSASAKAPLTMNGKRSAKSPRWI